MKTSSQIISRILTLSFIAVGAIASTGAGCPEGPMPGDGDGDGDGDVAFVFPRDGFTLNQADDADGDTSNGIQVDPPVRVAYGGPTGTELTLTSDQGEMATADVDDDGFARFSGFTVNGAPDGLPVVLTATDGTAEDEIEIEAITEVPLRVCTITSPADNAVLGPLDDAAINNPGFQAAVDVECQGVDAGTDVAVSVEGAVAQTVALDANGDAQAVVTLPNTDVGNNSNEISIDVDGLADEVDVTVVLTPPDPSVSITAPADGAALSPGDVDVTATSANATSATYDPDCSDDANDATGVALTLNAGTGDVTGTITGLSSDPPNTCELTVTVADGDGNTASDNVSFTVSAIAVAMDFPCDADDNGYLVAGEDADDGTDMVMNCAVPVTATFDSGTWTATGQLWDLGADVDDDADDVQVGADEDLGTLTSDMPVSFALAAPYGDEQAYEVRISVTDGADTIAAAAAISVDTVAPSLTWNNPIDASTLNAVNDDAQVDPGFQLFAAVTTTGLDAGLLVNLGFTGQSTFTETCAVTGTGVCTRDDIALDNGSWSVTADATDAAGNAATQVAVSFSVDATAPAVATPVDDNIIVADDAAGNDDGWLNAAESGDPAAAAVSDVTVNFATDGALEDGRMVTLQNGGIDLATAAATGNAVTFVGVALPEGALELGVSASDAAGNPIPAGAPTRTFNVDTVSPTASINSPTPGPLTNAMQTFAILTDADDGDAVDVVDVTGAPTVLGSATVTSGGASIMVTLPEGQGLAIEARVTDTAGNVGVAAETYDVDSVPPSLTLALLSDINTDQDGGAPGFQVDWEVTYSGMPAGGGNIDIASLLTMGDIGGATVPDAAGTVTIRTTMANGEHEVTARAEDGFGNAGLSNAVTVTVVSGEYAANFMPGTLVGGDLLFDAGDLPATVVVTILPSLPITGMVDLQIDGVSEPTQSVMRVGDDFTIAWTTNDGDSGTWELLIDDLLGTTGTSGQVDYVVDTSVPTVAFTTLIDNTQFNAADDQPATGGLQTTVSVDVTACENGSLTLTEGATTLGSASVGASGDGTLVVPVVDLTDHASDTWTATCVDQVGNTSPAANVLTEVDTVAPNAPVLNLATADAQRGQIDVTVTAPGDDGAAGGNVTLQVAASPSAVTVGTFAALYAQDFHPGVGGPVSETSGTAPGNDYALQTSRLAFDRDWNIAVIAVDNVGNTSFATQVETGLTTDLVTYNHVDDGFNADFGDPGQGNCDDDQFGFPLGTSADFNNDGFDDLVLSAPAQGNVYCYLSWDQGAVYLYSGQADLGTLDLGTPTRMLSDAASFSSGKRMDAADVNGDGFDDLIVAQEDYAPPFNVQLAVYYGEAGADLVADTPVVIDLGGDAFTFGIDTLRGIGDVNGDTFEDVYIGPWNGFSADTTQGRILFGQAADFDTSFANNTVTVLDETGAGTRLRGAAPLGNIDGDTSAGGNPIEDFALAVQDRGIALIRGRETWPATLDLNTITGDTLSCTGGACGVELSSGDINNDGNLDLVVMYGAGTPDLRVYLHNGVDDYAAAASYIIQPAGNLQVFQRGGLAVGDINGDGYADVVGAQSNANGQPTAATVWLGSDYPAATRTEPDALYTITIGPTAPGRMIPCGDLDNNGDDELCYATEAGAGTVYIRY